MSTLLLASFQAGLIACAVLLLERFAGRWLTPSIRLALWALVPLRLVLIIPITDPFGADRPSWWTWQDRPSSTQAELVPEVGSQPGPGLSKFQPDRATQEAEFMQLDDLTNAKDEAAGLSESAPALARGARSGVDLPHARGEAALGATASTRPSEATGEPADAFPWWLTIWALGFAVAIARTAHAELSLRRHLDEQQSPAPIGLQALADACASQLGMRRSVPVLQIDNLPSPAAYGWRHGRLLMPSNLHNELDEEELRFVLLHELAHLRHRDSIQNLVFALLGALHWFNPLVAFAHHRIREERELLRDQEALAALPHVSARRCAATLVKLLPRQQAAPSRASLSALVPHHRTTRRRISMIIQPWQPKRLQLLPGAACLAVLGWAGLTTSFASAPATFVQQGPSTPSTTGGTPPGPSAPRAQQHVRVTRQTAAPAWLDETLSKLTGAITWADQIEINEFASLIEASTGLSVRIDDSAYEYSDELCALQVKVPIRRALDLVCRQHNLHWEPEEGGILLTSRDEAPRRVELRFYDVTELVKGDEDRMDELRDIVMTLTDNGNTWDWDEVGLRGWNGQLLVRQTAPHHARVESVLNMLLTRTSPSAIKVPAAHIELFSKRFDIAGGDPVDAQLAAIFASLDIPYLVSPDYAGYEFEEDHKSMPLSAILEYVSEDMGGEFAYSDGVVFYGDSTPMHTSAYEVADLVTPTTEEVFAYCKAEYGSDYEEEHRADAERSIQEMKSEQLMNLFYDLLPDRLWDREGPTMLVWDDLLLITQSNEAHLDIESFLETARRAVRR
jgi:beta-lactamase regulating signal transducer with metallopeptidase domain